MNYNFFLGLAIVNSLKERQVVNPQSGEAWTSEFNLRHTESVEIVEKSERRAEG